eukprot:TRINITY_DN2453_c3_g1_i1.p1 TRINITY_DN2453_c3_g1~~TRINITY_DN2453_c3_g1_i1.p1  ORF type:complete len:906 (+),score=443.96 TRINITY_DN2453_c3_g1_i1:78-2720(+)
MEPPFSILPTQSVAAASGGVPQGEGRVAGSPPRPPAPLPFNRAATAAVDLQFGQVVSQRSLHDKEVDDLRASLKDKEKAMRDLQDRLAQVERQNDDLRRSGARKEEALKDEKSAGLAAYKAEFDAERKELSELLAQARTQVRTLTGDLKSKQITHLEEVRHLQQENKRLEMIADQCKNEANRTINALELELDKQTSLMAELEKQLKLKDEQVKKAKKEVQRMTESLEKVAKELVARNKERDEELLRRQHQASLDAKRSSGELASLMQEKREMVRSEVRLKEEVLLLKAQWDKAQTAKAELQEDINGLQAKLEAREEAEGITGRELADTLAQLEAMKQENNRLHAMVDRLNEQLHASAEGSQLSEEALSKLKNEVLEQETKLAHCERDRAAFAAKMVRLTEATAGEAQRMLNEVDDFRVAVREAAVQHAPLEARDVEMELLREQVRERERHAKVPPAAPLHHGDEHACVALVNRLRDDLVVSWEDLRVLRSDVGDEQARFGDLHMQHAALKDAYIVDREHVATLTTNLNEANAAYAVLQVEKQKLQETLACHEQLINECADIGKERDAQQMKILRENDALKEELGVHRKTRDAADDAVAAARAQVEDAEAGVAQAKLAQNAAEDAKKDLEAAVHELTKEARKLKQELAEEKEARAAVQQKGDDRVSALHRAETDAEVVKRQLRDKAQAMDDLHEKARCAETENKALQDENYRLRDTVKGFEARLGQIEEAGQRDAPTSQLLSTELHGQLRANQQLRGLQDEADAKIQGLELEKRQLGATVSELKKEVQVLWRGMQESNTENHHYREALRTLPPQSVSAPRDRRAASPAATPVSMGYSGRAGAHATPGGEQRYSQEEALRSVEERVMSLLSSRGAEMALWDR